MVVARDVLPYGWYRWEVETTFANEASESTLSCRCLVNPGPKRNSPAWEGESWPYLPKDLSASCKMFVLICGNNSFVFPISTNDHWIMSSTSRTLIVVSGSSSNFCSIRSDHIHVIGPQAFSIADWSFASSLSCFGKRVLR